VFTVYHSNQLDLLKSLLVSLIQQRPLSDPFQKELILVQSPGMAQWLKMALANEQQIVANVEFPLPATFIWQLFVRVLDGVPERSDFNKEAMTWKLMDILPSCLDAPEFADLAAYLEDSQDQQRAYQLAEKVADIFDQYLVYRPEWVLAWEQEQPVPELDDVQPWQQKLWRRLYDHTLALGQSPYHRANLYQEFIDTLTSHQHKPEGLADIERVFVFGISALPPRYLDALQALGEHVEVHFMFTNPCRYYWGDIRDKRYLAKRAALARDKISRIEDIPAESQLALGLDEPEHGEVGNSLLASMGKLGRDNLLLLSEMACNEIDSGFVEITRDNLLHHIQADILDLNEPGDPKQTETSAAKTEIEPDDASIAIHACHSPMREVEVLHDQLLAMFEANPSLSPRDVIVMVADINAYSPAIQAVFGNAPSERFIPFSISDRSADQESPVLAAFLRLLTLPDSRCSAAELLEILEVPAVSRRFAIDSQQFDQIKQWVEETGIRWGLDTHTASQFALPEQYQNTWLFGLKRMLLGYAMPSEAGLFADTVPYDEVQGLNAELAGRLGLFIDTLIYYQQQLAIECDGKAWVARLTQMLDDCFAIEGDEELAVKLIRTQLDSWLTQLSDAAFTHTLTLPVVRDYFNGRLNNERVSQRFLAGQVNFCTLMPMRSIPFDVVCLLGMNDGVYPRTVPSVGFDLMVGRTRAGDRSRRDDDRYLFLEALQSAQQRLYISYVGRSVQDNSLKVPSVLVTELLEYCTQGYCLAGDRDLPEAQSRQQLEEKLIQFHPLTPFSPDAFSGAGSYAQEWLPAAQGQGTQLPAFIGDALNPDPDSHQDPVIELAELQRFWRLPVRYFFQRRLKVFFEQLEAPLEEFEPFSLDTLHRFQLRDQLLAHFIETDDSPQSVQDFMARQRGQGKLPLAYFGELTLDSQVTVIRDMYQRLTPLLAAPRPDLELNLTLPTALGEVQLQGWLNRRYQDSLVRFHCGDLTVRHQLAVWIDHLCQCAMGEAVPSTLVGVKETIEFSPLSKDDALAHLQALVEDYQHGLNQPLTYLPSSVGAGIKARDGKKGFDNSETGQDKALKAIRDTFVGGFNPGEGQDPYIYRVWPQWRESLGQALLATGDRHLMPMLAQRQKR